MTSAGPAASAAGLTARAFPSPPPGSGRPGRRGACPVPDRGQGTVGLRLALTFIAVAVLAVALVAVLAVLFTDRDIAVLVQQRRDDLTNSLAADAVSTYNTGKPGWSDVDLAPALKLADGDGAQAAVLDARGRVVVSTLTKTAHSSGIISRELTSGGPADRHAAGPVHRPGPDRIGVQPARLAGPRGDRRRRAGRRAGAAGGGAGLPADHAAGHPADRIGAGDGPRRPSRPGSARSRVPRLNCANWPSPSIRWPTP